MSEQITLLDVCKLPDVQIHSKTALFKYLVNRESTEMQKLRENIVKLSYTNKIIGVRGNQVGITSKRIPLKFKQPKNIEEKANNNQIQFYYQNSGYIPHRNFYVAPLPTVKKNSQEKKLSAEKDKLKINGVTLQNLVQYQQTEFLKTNSWRVRSQSMAKLRIYQKRPTKVSYEIKIKSQNQNMMKRGRVKSFSNLLKQVNSNSLRNTRINPINHQQNTLFKRYQKISQRDHNTVENQEKEKQEIVLIDEQ